MSSPVGTKSAWVPALIVGALLLASGCGGRDEAQSEGTSTTSSDVDTAWFTMAAVSALSDAPCSSGATPSRDGAHCYQLEDGVVDASGIASATAVEDEAPACELAPGEVLCVADGTSPTPPKPDTWSVPFALTDAAIESFNELAEECYQRAPSCPTGQVAIVVDDQVVSAPTIQQPVFDQDAFVLSEGFDRSTAERIANRLSE